MNDREFDTDPDGATDIDPDDTGNASGDDNPNPDQTSADDTGEGNNEPDDDGYTPDERVELQQIQERHKSASDKISVDGQRIKTLEGEKAALEAKLAGGDNAGDRTRTSRPRPNRRRTSTRAGDTDERDGSGMPNFDDVDMSKLDPNTRRAMARLYDTTKGAVEQTSELRQHLSESDAESERVEQEDTLYQGYADRYGLSREQFNEMHKARSDGNHLEADRILELHSTASKRRRERTEGMNDDSGYLPNGSPNTPSPSRKPNKVEQLQKEFEDAPEDQKATVSQKIWRELPAELAEEITLPSPRS